MEAETCTFFTVLVNFSSTFSTPSFDNFVVLIKAWVLCTGRRTISRVLRFGGLSDEQRQHYSVFYRFFSRASWEADDLGLCLLQLVLRLLPDDRPLILVVDDTLCRKSGAHIWGSGMHHDPLLSNYGRGKTLVKFFSFGHNWVILCVCVPTPWATNRVIAIPIAFRLYRSKKLCPDAEYSKRTQLARQLVEKVLVGVPETRAVQLVGDTEYACRTLVRNLPSRVVFVGPMHMDAALYALPKPHKGRGRPRKKGERVPSPRQLINDEHIPWQKKKVILYGREVDVLFKMQVALWYTVAGTRLVRLFVTRDPKGILDDRAYFSTDAEMSIHEFALLFSCRWSQEEMHHNVKHHLGLEDPQNGWWRHPAGIRRNDKIPGPQPHKQRGELAVRHTVPFVLTTYAVIVLWYLANGTFQEDVERVRQRVPWYRHKATPSFSDMLAALRRHLWAERIISEPYVLQGSTNNITRMDPTIEDLLCAA